MLIYTRDVFIAVVAFNVPLLLLNLILRKLSKKNRKSGYFKIALWLSHIGQVSVMAGFSMVYGCIVAPYIIKILNMEEIYMGIVKTLSIALIGASAGYFLGWNMAKENYKVDDEDLDPSFKETEDDDDWDDDWDDDVDADLDCPPINNEMAEAAEEDDPVDDSKSEGNDQEPPKEEKDEINDKEPVKAE